MIELIKVSAVAVIDAAIRERDALQEALAHAREEAMEWRRILQGRHEALVAFVAELRTGQNVRRSGWEIADELEARFLTPAASEAPPCPAE